MITGKFLDKNTLQFFLEVLRITLDQTVIQQVSCCHHSALISSGPRFPQCGTSQWIIF